MNQRANPRTRTDMLLLVAFCGFLFFYGLGAFGLVGADEPRYAHVAHEMLDRSDWVTPTLQGKPWLEKPVLYYWQGMGGFRVAAITDPAARLPAPLGPAGELTGASSRPVAPLSLDLRVPLRPTCRSPPLSLSHCSAGTHG